MRAPCPPSPGPFASALSLFITFLLVGAWHGDGLNWILYGAYHGSGLAVWYVFDHLVRRQAPHWIAEVRKHPVYRIGAMVATFNFVAWGLLLTADLRFLRELLKLGW